MAVFTSVSPEEVGEWLRPLAVGELRSLRGIVAGIENTNYFATTSHADYVLTIFEKLTAQELPFYLGLTEHLARHGVPCPAPVAAADGSLFGHLKGKPAALVTRLAGTAVVAPSVAQCEAVGAMLAQMHQIGASYEGTLANPRGLHWWRETAPKVQPFLDSQRAALLTTEIAYQIDQSEQHQREQHQRALPRGPIHADLFRDNVLFEGTRIGGVIDFYFAGVDAWLLDVAITLNDWCVDLAAGTIDATRAHGFLGAYRRVRPFTAAEHLAWPGMLRAAALRFWLSRLYDYHLPRPGELIRAHDPEHFRRVLQLRVASAGAPPPL